MIKFTLTRLTGIVILCVSCQHTSMKYEVHPEVEEYFQTFSNRYDVDVSHIQVRFVDNLGGTAGECHNFRKTFTKTIVLNRIRWEKFDYYQRENLVFHELVHCQFGMLHEHSYTLITKGGRVEEIPTSIMHPAMMSHNIYKKYRLYYQKQLEIYKNH